MIFKKFRLFKEMLRFSFFFFKTNVFPLCVGLSQLFPGRRRSCWMLPLLACLSSVRLSQLFRVITWLSRVFLRYVPSAVPPWPHEAPIPSLQVLPAEKECPSMACSSGWVQNASGESSPLGCSGLAGPNPAAATPGPADVCAAG